MARPLVASERLFLINPTMAEGREATEAIVGLMRNMVSDQKLRVLLFSCQKRGL